MVTITYQRGTAIEHLTVFVEDVKREVQNLGTQVTILRYEPGKMA